MRFPKLTGRDPHQPLVATKPMVRSVSVQLPYQEDMAHATLFLSAPQCATEGIVIRLELDTLKRSSLPNAVFTEKGIELHISGKAEAEALMWALAQVVRRFDR